MDTLKLEFLTPFAKTILNKKTEKKEKLETYTTSIISMKNLHVRIREPNKELHVITLIFVTGKANNEKHEEKWNTSIDAR